MKVCSKCGKQFLDTAKFCDICGIELVEEVQRTEEPKEEWIFCTNCGTKLKADSQFCHQCGATMVAKKTKRKKGKGKYEEAGGSRSSKRGIAILVSVVIVTVVALGVWFGINQFSNSSGANNHYGMILKDNELSVLELKKPDEALIEITEELCDEDLSEYDLYDINSFVTWRKNGTLVFFPDKIDYDEGNISIYYRDLGDRESENVKIDSGVSCYFVNDAGDLVTYIKETNNDALYQYNFDSKEKIASDVYRVFVSAKGDVIYFLDYEGTLYVKKLGEDKRKLDSDVEYINYVSADYKTVYYIKNQSLYRIGAETEKQKIAADVAEVIKCYDSGQVYYSKNVETKLIDYIKNPNVLTSDTHEYVAEYGIGSYQTVQELYYYDGEKEILISGAMLNESISVAATAPMIIFAESENPSPQIAVEEDISVYDVENLIGEKMWESYVWVAASETQKTAIADQTAGYFSVDETGSTIYYLDDINASEGVADLYCVEQKDHQFQTANLVDTGVSNWNAGSFGGDLYTYFKDTQNSSGDFYVEGKLVDYDVELYSETTDSKRQMIYYYTDWDDENELGTLKMYDGERVQKVSDDVHTHVVNADGSLLYLYDYNTDREIGELYLYRSEEKNEKITDDVTGIIVAYSSQGSVQHGY